MPRKPVQLVLHLLLCGMLLHGLSAGAETGLDARVSKTQVNPDWIREKVAAHVKTKLQTLIAAEDKDRISVNVLKIPSAPLNFSGAPTVDNVHITVDSSLGEVYSERAVVRVHLELPNGESRDLGVPVHITVKKPVWIVKNPVHANAPLRANDFKLETREVSHNYGYVAGQERAINQYVARVNLQPGEVLDVRKIVLPPDVSTNNEVRIFMTNGNGMTVSVPGIALANARIGETVRVRQSQYQRKYFNAKVISKNQVLVEM